MSMSRKKHDTHQITSRNTHNFAPISPARDEQFCRENTATKTMSSPKNGRHQDQHPQFIKHGQTSLYAVANASRLIRRKRVSRSTSSIDFYTSRQSRIWYVGSKNRKELCESSDGIFEYLTQASQRFVSRTYEHRAKYFAPLSLSAARVLLLPELH